MRWSSQFRRNSSCSALLQSAKLHAFRIQDFHLLWSFIPKSSTMQSIYNSFIAVGSSPFNRLYLGNRYYFLFLWVLRCFNSPGLLLIAMYSLWDNSSSCYWVPPFGHLRIFAYLLLPVAFRCSSRPSSPISAKASSMRPLFIYLTNFNLVLLFFVWIIDNFFLQKLSIICFLSWIQKHIHFNLKLF